ncbi:hypothetical protein [Agromyces protaetiae]|uniref:aggregation-promoting factor C-terminal-like domain-containing protein n=1 Tax=Agromyces protaetiae TaxID=2509455 RepID=UPI001AA0352A|nr:hypothetical protein [Agromyces protaetiae]
MQNQISPETSAPEQGAPKPTGRRAAAKPRTGFFLAAGAVVALGAMVGTGFAVQSSFAAQSDRVAETSALTAAANLDVDQLEAHSAVLDARVKKTANDTITAATAVIASASGKADATALAASVASLGGYEKLDAKDVFALAKTTTAQADAVRAQVAEFDRVAAEQAAAAAAQAAAEAEAAKAQRAQAPSSGSRPAAPSNPSEAQAIARDLMAAMYGWGDDQFGCLVQLWNRESGWNVHAANSSGAYGIPQALPGSKMASAGPDWQNSADTQIRWGLGYISGRYGTPCGAWDSFNAKGWY